MKCLVRYQNVIHFYSLDATKSLAKEDSFENCGISPVPPKETSVRIANAKPSGLYHYPWSVLIMRQCFFERTNFVLSQKAFIWEKCSGTLITLS